MKLYDGICAACAEDVGPCESYPCYNSDRSLVERIQDAYEKEHGTVGSYNMTTMFDPTSKILQRVGDLEHAGRTLVGHIGVLRARAYLERPIPDDVKKAMEIFGEVN